MHVILAAMNALVNINAYLAKKGTIYLQGHTQSHMELVIRNQELYHHGRYM